MGGQLWNFASVISIGEGFGPRSAAWVDHDSEVDVRIGSYSVAFVTKKITLS